MFELNHVLSNYNDHIRDSSIQFFEEGHKYVITTDPDSKYTSVTTWNHSHFSQFDAEMIIKNMMKGRSWKEGHKYWGMNTDEIKKLWNDNAVSVSGAGTKLHFRIECFMNNPYLESGYTHKELLEHYEENKYMENNEPVEWEYFINFVRDFPHLKPYRTEWMIYDEGLKLAGSIDMVYENSDGTISIYDWKRCKNITRINNFNKYAKTERISGMPDSNFWHYALQLNTYKAILESKYNKTVKELFLVKLHPEDEDKNYELIPIPFLQREIKDLFHERETHIMFPDESHEKI